MAIYNGILSSFYALLKRRVMTSHCKADCEDFVQNAGMLTLQVQVQEAVIFRVDKTEDADAARNRGGSGIGSLCLLLGRHDCRR